MGIAALNVVFNIFKSVVSRYTCTLVKISTQFSHYLFVQGYRKITGEFGNFTKLLTKSGIL